MSRPDRQAQRDSAFLKTALALSELGTCGKRKVGAVVTNMRHRIRGTGHNGKGAGLPHCTDQPCPGMLDQQERQSLYTCEAVHAEVNALADCPDVWSIETIYTTVSPCAACVNVLLNTSLRRIVFLEEHHHTEARDRWLKAGRQWEQGKILF